MILEAALENSSLDPAQAIATVGGVYYIAWRKTGDARIWIVGGDARGLQLTRIPADRWSGDGTTDLRPIPVPRLFISQAIGEYLRIRNLFEMPSGMRARHPDLARYCRSIRENHWPEPGLGAMAGEAVAQEDYLDLGRFRELVKRLATSREVNDGVIEALEISLRPI